MDMYTGETDDGYHLYDGKYHTSGNCVNSQIRERIRDNRVSADASSYSSHYMVVWGLEWARRMDAMGGSIAWTSSPGGGTRVTLTWPVTPPAPGREG